MYTAQKKHNVYKIHDSKNQMPGKYYVMKTNY